MQRDSQGPTKTHLPSRAHARIRLQILFNLHATNTPMHCRMFPQRDSAHIQSPLHTSRTIDGILSTVGFKASQPPKKQGKKQSAIQQLAIRPTRSAPSTAFVRSYFAQRPEVGGPVSVPTCGTKGKRFRCWGSQKQQQ